MADRSCGGDNGDRSPEKRCGLALKVKSADKRFVQAKMDVGLFPFLSALSGLVGIGVVLFVVGLIVWCLWVA